MFVVLEGLDGAGKSTQIALLREYLNSRNIPSEQLHFPRFDAPIYGDLVARFLRGEFGSADSVNSYLVALLFAGDRAQAAPQLQGWLDAGRAVVLDRYVYSNIGYQCGKLPQGAQRNKLAEWILDLEYRHNAIPEPDISIFLDVPFSFTERKLTESRKGDDREYLDGAEDIHEASLSLQRNVREVYIECAKSDDKLHIIDCSDAEGGMLYADAIFEKIVKLIEQKFNL